MESHKIHVPKHQPDVGLLEGNQSLDHGISHRTAMALSEMGLSLRSTQ